ncbi:MAG: flagellar biosynthesis protein FlhB [Lachnospiraceae bacterium]|nr:flagellar biosynthesis protein FlhB [Lachnospiraceae bacterium]
MILEYNLQFFAQEGPGGEKTEEPTGKKLDDARKEGQVAKSQEIASSFTLLALFVLLKAWLPTTARQLGELFEGFYARFAYFSSLPAYTDATDAYSDMLAFALIRIMIIMLPFLLMSFIVAFVSDIAQVKWKPTRKPLAPKLSKLNPINGIKRIFSLQKLVEVLKSVLKIAVMCGIIYNEVADNIGAILILYDVPLIQGVISAGNLLIDTGLKIAAVFVVIAFADYAFQKWKFHRDMKMTKQEVKEEYKSTEGDPQIKGKIRQRMQEASRRRMMNNLPKADVVITNPTHFAVAIRYDKSIAEAPLVIAKGADYMALKIRESAKEYNIQIVENKPLARALYANTEIGDQIPPELYVPVAEILAAVYRADGRVGADGRIREKADQN